MLDLRHRAGLQIAQGDFGFWVQFLEVDRGFARKLLAVAIRARGAVDGDLKRAPDINASSRFSYRP
jgi:hypothetical protein